MCKCTPNIKTPFCGKPGCEWPEQRPSKERDIAGEMRLAGYHDWAGSVEHLLRENFRWQSAHKIVLDENSRFLAELRALHGCPCKGHPTNCYRHPNDCGCRVVLDDETLLSIARQWDQGPWATFEFDTVTLLRMMRSLAATVESMVRDKAATTEPCEQLEGACPNCNQWVVLKCPAQPPGDDPADVIMRRGDGG